ncbi:hypothetical protein A9974_02855 [Achromobacter sp. UMC71]|nr:hypothetical protein [Achromobacter sp. UMC71]
MPQYEFEGRIQCDESIDRSFLSKFIFECKHICFDKSINSAKKHQIAEGNSIPEERLKLHLQPIAWKTLKFAFPDCGPRILQPSPIHMSLRFKQ